MTGGWPKESGLHPSPALIYFNDKRQEHRTTGWRIEARSGVDLRVCWCLTRGCLLVLRLGRPTVSSDCSCVVVARLFGIFMGIPLKCCVKWNVNKIRKTDGRGECHLSGGEEAVHCAVYGTWRSYINIHPTQLGEKKTKAGPVLTKASTDFTSRVHTQHTLLSS